MEYQLGMYYGIFFDFEFLSIMENVLKSDQKWAGLVSEHELVKIDKHLILFGLSSDINDNNKRLCMLFADILTIQGECSQNNNTYLDIDLSLIVKNEHNNAQVIGIINSLYTFIIKSLLKYKLNIPLYCGWRVVSCEWVDDTPPTIFTPRANNKFSMLKNIKSKIMHSPRANLSESSEMLKLEKNI